MPALQAALMRPVLAIDLPAAYRAAEVLAYHGRDPASRTERVAGAEIRKAMRLENGPALIAIDLAAPHRATIAADRDLDAGEAACVGKAARRMLGLSSDADGFARHPAGEALAAARPGLRLPLTADPWEAVCWAVIGQQINLSFAAALRRELADLAGTPHGPDGLLLHPGPAEVAALAPEALTARRFSRAKAAYLIGVAQAIAGDALDLDGLAMRPPDEAEAALVALHGIGRWTARYIMLRGLGFADVAPVGDSGLATALQRRHGLAERPDTAMQEGLMAAFAPFRSLASAHLWASLAAPAAAQAGPVTKGRV